MRNWIFSVVLCFFGCVVTSYAMENSLLEQLPGRYTAKIKDKFRWPGVVTAAHNAKAVIWVQKYQKKDSIRYSFSFIEAPNGVWTDDISSEDEDYADQYNFHLDEVEKFFTSKDLIQKKRIRVGNEKLEELRIGFQELNDGNFVALGDKLSDNVSFVLQFKFPNNKLHSLRFQNFSKLKASDGDHPIFRRLELTKITRQEGKIDWNF
jgi:hypothetical protein